MMKHPPAIIVQLVHIEGPMKGEIQELSEPTISIGRYSSTHVNYPKDLSVVSRKHAEIVREGIRFKLIDQSTNGTFVNGKRIKEIYLKNGDVLTFAKNGPKLSFLTKVVEGQAAATKVETVPSPLEKPVAPPAKKPPTIPDDQANEKQIPIQRVQVSLMIQYGPTLRSFRELPITIGQNPNCDFNLGHPSILDRHAQIFFSDDQYWVKDLTGQDLISIDGQAIHHQAPLTHDNRLALSLQGPVFRFISGGRLAEIEESGPEKSVNSSPEKEDIPPRKNFGNKESMGAISALKKFLRH